MMYYLSARRLPRLVFVPTQFQNNPLKIGDMRLKKKKENAFYGLLVPIIVIEMNKRTKNSKLLLCFFFLQHSFALNPSLYPR